MLPASPRHAMLCNATGCWGAEHGAHASSQPVTRHPQQGLCGITACSMHRSHLRAEQPQLGWQQTRWPVGRPAWLLSLPQAQVAPSSPLEQLQQATDRCRQLPQHCCFQRAGVAWCDCRCGKHAAGIEERSIGRGLQAAVSLPAGRHLVHCAAPP